MDFLVFCGHSGILMHSTSAKYMRMHANTHSVARFALREHALWYKELWDVFNVLEIQCSLSFCIHSWWIMRIFQVLSDYKRLNHIEIRDASRWMERYSILDPYIHSYLSQYQADCRPWISCVKYLYFRLTNISRMIIFQGEIAGFWTLPFFDHHEVQLKEIQLNWRCPQMFPKWSDAGFPKNSKISKATNGWYALDWERTSSSTHVQIQAKFCHPKHSSIETQMEKIIKESNVFSSRRSWHRRYRFKKLSLWKHGSA